MQCATGCLGEHQAASNESHRRPLRAAGVMPNREGWWSMGHDFERIYRFEPARRRRRLDPTVQPLEGRRLLSAFTVDSTAGDGSSGTLRWAIEQANATSGANTIDFDPTAFATAKTIALASGQLELSNTTGPLTIDGPSAGVTIDGGGLGRVFQIDPGVAASFSGLTIVGGDVTGSGGGLYDEGTLTLTGCTVSGNTASQYGGGLDTGTGGSVSLSGCNILGNSASDNGGGLEVAGPTTLLSSCTISGNSAGMSAGGIFVHAGTATLTDCQITGNSAPTPGMCGGLINEGDATLSDCTISGNQAGSYAGLWNEGTATLSGFTIAGNSAAEGNGGGVANRDTITLTGCTISGNSARIEGGGLYNMGPSPVATLVDCTIVGNSAVSSGGGLAISGTAKIVACTISGNSTATYGGGLYTGAAGPGAVTIDNTIIAGNVAAGTGVGPVGDIMSSGDVVTGAYDLVGTGGSGLADLVTGDPDLGPLADNGGPTQTMALMFPSAAIAAGSAALEVDAQGHPLTVDQRGEPLDTPVPDIGAFQTPPRITLAFSGMTSPTLTYGTSSVTLSGTLSGGNQSPPGTEVVAITIYNGMYDDTQTAAIGAGGAFSVAFKPGDLQASSTPYAVTYSYAGDATFAPATATAELMVSRAMPMVLVRDEGGAFDGSAFPATATVAGVDGQAAASLEEGAPTIAYYAGDVATGTPLAGPPIAAGKCTAVAGFVGSLDYAPSTGDITFTIGRFIPGLTTSDVGGTYDGSAFPATATITGIGGPSGPTLEGVAPLIVYYAGDVANGTPMSAAPTSVGTYTAVASFAGSADYLENLSLPVTFTIAPATPTVTLATSAVSADYGQSVTFTATVTGPGVAGIVTFSDGSTVLGTISLDASGRAALTTSALSAAGHAITATYDGDPDDQATASAAASEFIARAGTGLATTITPTHKKKKVVSVKLAAYISPVPPGGGVPTGSLIFEVIARGKGKKAGTKPEVLGTATLAGGAASLTLPAYRLSNRPITIVYQGDPDFAPSQVATRVTPRA